MSPGDCLRRGWNRKRLIDPGAPSLKRFPRGIDARRHIDWTRHHSTTIEKQCCRDVPLEKGWHQSRSWFQLTPLCHIEPSKQTPGRTKQRNTHCRVLLIFERNRTGHARFAVHEVSNSQPV